jgi:tetratricopeptide (TPR) repeat protein
MPNTPTLWNIPYQRNPYFTGREDVLTELHHTLHAENTVALSHPQGISGLGGIGKTQTALEYAYRYRAEYNAVFWVRADSVASLTSSLVELARLLELPERDEQDQEIIVQAVLRWFRLHPDWLLIYDNVDDLSITEPFLPKAGRGHLLFTTRAHALGGLAQRLDIKKMEPDIGALLLLRRASLLALQATLNMANSDDQGIARAISEELGGLPLALDQAGAYIKEAPCSLTDYLTLYQSHRRDLLRSRPGLRVEMPRPVVVDTHGQSKGTKEVIFWKKINSFLSHAGRFLPFGFRSQVTSHAHPVPYGEASDIDYPASVATTWSLSFEKVRQASPAAAELLDFCAFLAPDAIPEEMITQGVHCLTPLLQAVAAQPLQFDQMIAVPLAYSLLHRNTNATLNIHRLVQAVLSESMPTEARQQWKQRVVLAVKATYPNVQNVAQWDACEQWLPHALVCATWIEQEQIYREESADLLNRTGYYLDDRARYAEAHPLYLRAVAIYKQLLGATHPNTTFVHNNLALLYLNQGKYREAQTLLELVFESQIKYAKEEMALQRDPEMREQQGEIIRSDKVVSRTLNNLAMLYEKQGRHAEAEMLFQRDIEIVEEELGETHPFMATSLNNLASLYTSQRRYAEAEMLLLRALNIYEEQLGAEHPSIATSLNNLALLSQEQGRYDEAEELFLRSLAIFERISGHEHPDTQQVRKYYASLLQTIGRDADTRKQEEDSSSLSVPKSVSKASWSVNYRDKESRD